MLYAYVSRDGQLQTLPPGADPAGADWIDLYAPQPEQTALVKALGIDVPTLEDMEEIEVSNRLYREGEVEYLTVVLPGLSTTKTPVTGPVTFCLSPTRLVTVRHHAPRPFETFAGRAGKGSAGCADVPRIFLGLIEEIIGRLADLLEGSGRTLDEATRTIFGGKARRSVVLLQETLESIGREGEAVGRIRLCLLTLERALTYIQESPVIRFEAGHLRPHLKARLKDIQSLEVHTDFLSARVANAIDATLGMVNLAQNVTVRVLSAVAALFLPPTLIASVYGMNFKRMPELEWLWGYPFAIVLMVASALVTYLWLRWRKWL